MSDEQEYATGGRVGPPGDGDEPLVDVSGCSLTTEYLDAIRRTTDAIRNETGFSMPFPEVTSSDVMLASRVRWDPEFRKYANDLEGAHREVTRRAFALLGLEVPDKQD